MTVIKMNWRKDDSMLHMVEWLERNIGGPCRKLQNGKFTGPGWTICNASEMRKPANGPNPLPYLITKVEIYDPEVALMFRLTWT